MSLSTVLGNVTKAIALINPIAAELPGAIGVVGTLVGLGMTLVHDLQGTPDADTFAAEIAAFDTEIATGFAQDAAWRIRHGLPPRVA